MNQALAIAVGITALAITVATRYEYCALGDDLVIETEQRRDGTKR
jgi:hypothetical protein